MKLIMVAAAALLAVFQGTRTVWDRTTMPVGREGQLSSQQNADITAFILQINRFPPGAEDLPGQTIALKQIAFVMQKP